jgi:hypothetical protein
MDLDGVSSMFRVWRDTIADDFSSPMEGDMDGPPNKLTTLFPELKILYNPRELLLFSQNAFKVTRSSLAACDDRYGIQVLKAKAEAGLWRSRGAPLTPGVGPSGGGPDPEAVRAATEMPLLLPLAVVVAPSPLERMPFLRAHRAFSQQRRVNGAAAAPGFAVGMSPPDAAELVARPAPQLISMWSAQASERPKSLSAAGSSSRFPAFHFLSHLPSIPTVLALSRSPLLLPESSHVGIAGYHARRPSASPADKTPQAAQSMASGKRGSSYAEFLARSATQRSSADSHEGISSRTAPASSCRDSPSVLRLELDSADERKESAAKRTLNDSLSDTSTSHAFHADRNSGVVLRSRTSSLASHPSDEPVGTPPSIPPAPLPTAAKPEPAFVDVQAFEAIRRQLKRGFSIHQAALRDGEAPGMEDLQQMLARADTEGAGVENASCQVTPDASPVPVTPSEAASVEALRSISEVSKKLDYDAVAAVEDLPLDSPLARSTSGASIATASSSAPVPAVAARLHTLTRIDVDPAFFERLYSLSRDLQIIDGTIATDVSVLTRKVNVAKSLVLEAKKVVDRTRQSMGSGEAEVTALLDEKKAVSIELHLLVTSGSAGKGSGPAAAPFAATPVTLKRYGGALSALDSKLKAASAVWQRLVWDHTMACTRLEELQAAEAALMSQLASVVAAAESEKRSKLLHAWRELCNAHVRRLAQTALQKTSSGDKPHDY